MQYCAEVAQYIGYPRCYICGKYQVEVGIEDLNGCQCPTEVEDEDEMEGVDEVEVEVAEVVEAGTGDDDHHSHEFMGVESSYAALGLVEAKSNTTTSSTTEEVQESPLEGGEEAKVEGEVGTETMIGTETVTAKEFPVDDRAAVNAEQNHQQDAAAVGADYEYLEDLLSASMEQLDPRIVEMRELIEVELRQEILSALMSRLRGLIDDRKVSPK
jgi:hypothetical protein